LISGYEKSLRTATVTASLWDYYYLHFITERPFLEASGRFRKLIEKELIWKLM